MINIQRCKKHQAKLDNADRTHYYHLSPASNYTLINIINDTVTKPSQALYTVVGNFLHTANSCTVIANYYYWQFKVIHVA